MAGRPVQFTNNTRMSRRTALTNYFDYDDERLMFEHLESFPTPAPAPPASASSVNYSRSHAPPAAPPRPPGVFELLQSKFGFQRASVANQKENFACWIANYQIRVDAEGGGDLYAALWRVHGKFLKNYRKWCKFLGTTAHVAPDGAPSHLLEKQIALFLCVWGEAANVRFMPECICFLYHTMADKLTGVETLPDVPEGYYLEHTVRPIYDVIAKMRTAASSADPAKLVDHQDITNYDDLNEFFWTPACLDYDEHNVAEALKVQDPKTFKEKRSVFNPVLAFFRVWFFLLLVFHILVVFAYVGYYTKDEGAQGWAYYAHWFDSAHSDRRNHALLSVLLTVSVLFTFKVILQIWLYGMRLFKDVWLTLGVLCRLFWHACFFAIFLLVNVSPSEPCFIKFGSLGKGSDGSAATYLSVGGYMALFYCIPILLASSVRMFCAQGIWSIRFLNSLDGTRRQYIGRDMSQPWRWFLLYGATWSTIFFLKFLFALELMIRPLVGPTIQVYETAISSKNGIVESNHNLLFITALWAPVIVVYLYDTQIWFILYQSIMGLYVGLKRKMGHYATMETMKTALYTAPEQFDKTVASLRAQAQRVTTQSDPEKSREESLRLRFAIIWNEIISSFRLNDLLDDRETVILQYRILGHGRNVENPIFLFAGMVIKAVDIATKARPNAWSTAELTARLEKAGVLDGAMDAARLASEVFHLLFGASEDEGPLSVLERIYSSTDIVTLLDFQYLPTLVENVVDLLSAILDLPDDLSTVEREEPEFEEARVAFQEQTRLVVDKVTLTFNTIELMFGNDASVHEKLKRCKFTKLTTMLSFQKQQLLSLYKADATADSSVLSSSTSRGSSRGSEASFDSTASTKYSREDFVGSCTRLFFLLRLDVAQSYPRCQDARRRLTFFLHTLNMDMPKVPSVEAMPSFSVMTPYYSETVLFTLNELKNPVNSNPLFERIDGRNREKGRDNLTIMGYLITFHAEEWCNFLERMGVNTLEEAIEHYPRQVRLWASLRGQTLARTVYGMMMYEDALRLLRWLELWNKEDLQEAEKVSEMNYISALKFSYITGCQIYSQQAEKGDPRADDIDFLMKRFPSWRVSFVDAIKDENGTIQRYDCVLVKSEGEEIVEVYRYELPGNPILGEGKPENQNVALPFTRGEYLQTIDMNQEHYFEETLKMPNFLATAAASGEDVTIIGMKEHVFTGRASSLARFMTLQELVFVTLTQRVLAEPLRARMHYGHPDVFEKSFVMTNGGVSKASKGINLSEDVFSGYNVTLRGGLVTHVEFMQCGKGRDVTLNQINAFEAKLSNGCAESCLSREGHRMSNSLDFFRLNSMYYGHFGFYICNAMTVLCVYIYAYSKLYVATHNNVIETAATSTKDLDSLAKVMTTQYILQFGLLTTLPLLSTLIVEFGWKQAVFQVMELVSALGVVFYVFLTGTKAHYYDVALIRGGSKYRATGRGFAITRDTMVNFFKDYGVSHFRKAVELIGVMILYGVYGDFSIGVGARDEFCASASFDCDEFPSLIPVNVTTLEAFGSTPQSYGVASFAVLLLGACWLMAPFLFNTDGLVLEKTKIDVSHWFAWMMRVKCDEELIDDSSSEGTPKDGWIDWYNEDVNLMTKVGPMGRATYCLRELRHPFAMYFVFATHFSNGQWPLLICAVLMTWGALWVGSYVALQSVGRNQKQVALSVRGLLYMVLVLGSITVFPVVIGKLLGWSALKGFTLSVSIFIGLNAICQYALAFHGAFGLPLASWSPFVTLGFLHDMMVGVFLVVPLVVLSFLPFMRILQTRMMFNGGFARALSTGSEVAASICMLMGVTGGYIYGFMSCFILNLGFVNAPKYHYISRSFYFYVTNELNNKGAINMPQWLVNGQLKALCSIIAVLAVLSSYLVGRVLGRRGCMGIGAGLITFGLGLNFVDDGVVIVVASCFISAGSVFLAANYALYSYEICTKGWRGKGLTMFLLGSTVGFLVNATVHNKLNQTTFNQDFKNRPANNWRTLPMVAVLPILVVFMIALRYIPESPVWFMTQGDAVKCKATYVRLRRRQDVSYDMKTLEQQIYERKGTRNIPFRVAFVFTLQSVLSILMSGGLLKRTVVKETTTSDGIRNSSELVYFGVCSAIGLSFSVFLIDNVRRKTILKDFLPFLAAVCIITASVNTAVVGKDGVIEGFVWVIVVATGLSFQSVAVLCSLEMFGAANRALFYSLSLGMFYAVQGLIFYFSPSFSLCHFLFGASCLALTLLMFGLCASTKEKAIQLKSEKKKQKDEAAAAAAAAAASGNVSPADMEQRPSLVAEAMQRQASRQQIRIAQASTAMAPPHNAYIGQSHLSSVPSSGTHNSNMSGTANGNGNATYLSGSVVDLHALQRTGLGNLTSIAQSNSFRSSSDNGSVQLAALRRRQLGNASSELSSYSRLSSLHADDLDLEAEFDLLFNEVANPVEQSRSQSFLESRAFPDSEVRAETRGYGLRL